MGLITKIKRKAKTLDNMIRPLANDKWDYFVIVMDFLWCRSIFKVSRDEYLKYNFHNLKHRYRKNFLLHKHRIKYSNINYRGLGRSKYLVYKHISDLYQREVILAPQCGEASFLDFCKKYQQIVLKADTGSMGKSVELFNYTDDATAIDLFATFSKEKPKICEPFIRQHKILKQLNPVSVNTLRITSLLQNGEVEILSATLKCGVSEDNITDNLSMGGIGAQVDISSGIVSTFGYDFEQKKYAYHPTTGVKIIGMQLPHWDTVISLVKAAHARLPQCALFGWDIAITETGADIVEANNRPGARIMQRMDGIPKGKKIIPLIRQDRLKNKRKVYTAEMKKLYTQEFQVELSE
ncbi:MAG: hypothetical protein E7455_04065 [Ruminococcaceae bacterium]|nr:hypothetical protein [Oscillospiraceae bacterium]